MVAQRNATLNSIDSLKNRHGQSGELIPSLYNFRVNVGASSLLYNTASGALVRLDGKDGFYLARMLTHHNRARWVLEIPLKVRETLVDAGFLVPVDLDEIAEVRRRYWEARTGTPMVLTITTTQDCNLGCFYCYEERYDDYLASGDIADLVRSAEERLRKSGKRGLHVDWYGGEPLLNVEFLELASEALQTLCRDMEVGYHASVISNGTRWPQDVGDFVKRHKIRQVQISFDGVRERHNKTRRYRPGYAQGEASSFDEAVRLVDTLLDNVRVDIRINIGRHNLTDIKPFLEMARSRGWFRKRFPAVIQPARLSAYTDECSFLRPRELSQDEFDSLRREIRDMVASETMVEDTEAPDGLPLPKSSVCAALARDSVVIGADGHEYRCGLQVGQRSQASGHIRSKASLLPIIQPDAFPDRTWWDNFDPTTLPSCSRCSFLPICFGGCPLKHLRGDEHAVAEQGTYWRRNLPRLIVARSGMNLDNDFVFSAEDQFRHRKSECFDAKGVEQENG